MVTQNTHLTRILTPSFTKKQYLARCGSIAFFGTSLPLLLLVCCVVVNIYMQRSVPHTGHLVFSPSYSQGLIGGKDSPTQAEVNFGSTIRIRSVLRPSYYLAMLDKDIEPVIGSSEKFTHAKEVTLLTKNSNTCMFAAENYSLHSLY